MTCRSGRPSWSVHSFLARGARRSRQTGGARGARITLLTHVALNARRSIETIMLFHKSKVKHRVLLRGQLYPCFTRTPLRTGGARHTRRPILARNAIVAVSSLLSRRTRRTHFTGQTSRSLFPLGKFVQ